MCKLHTYYITNAKQELPYYAINIPESQLRTQIINSIMEIGDELEEITEADFDVFNGENMVNMEIDTSRVYNLNITQEVELESQIFNIEQQLDEDDDDDQTIN
jgi:hypothetical protein